ncbi:histidine ammonia-lyase isoform X3 [Hemiscyllium ocellatum]|uniref:histidine ammonia-lyase isoform X3 n=1 Tax=Hemiscyllium ocellatum TaxID=170820 RepID=UPI002966021F|nr:histidine ammonia-lyase isoform X3 [Hemiscyllium ocellatum]
MARFTVHVRGEWLTVPCKDTSVSVAWLATEALRRYAKNKPDSGGMRPGSSPRFMVRRCQGLGSLDLDDAVRDVLEDNEFIEIVLEDDLMSSEFIPTQPERVHLYSKYQEPTEYICLDGNHLTIEDLVQLGRGLYKIKLTTETEERIKQSRLLLENIVKENKASCLSYVPEKGTVGASGDLAPLAHLALGLIGEGKMWSPKSGWADAKYVLQAHGLKPVSLKPKEGLALINGTQMITSLGAEAVERATAIARQADIIAALTLEVLKGTTRAFDSDIHKLRPHPGQMEVAFRFRSLLGSDHHPSEIAESHRFCDRVQDAYTLRCCPQVHGVVNDTIAFVKTIIETEINSATDNPMVFAERGETISGGNFHGEYPAKALDYLAISVHELAAISERRIERLCNPSLSELPAFLVNEGGLNSGFMIAHCTAAALVSENKVLCHPSSVDSLSTSAATEDHVSMGGWAARKALRVIEHVEQVLAIELLAACQGIEFLRPLKTTTPLEKVYDLVRTLVRPWIKDRFMAPDIDIVHRLLVEQKVWEVAHPYIEKYRSANLPEARPISPTAFTLEPPMSPCKRARIE